MKTIDFARSVIGKPFAQMGKGPESYDCLGLFQCAYKSLLGVEIGGTTDQSFAMQVRAINDGTKSSDWIEIDRPKMDLDVVAMGQKSLIHHVGVWIESDGGRVLHASRGNAGVVAQNIESIREAGYRTIKFYRHKCQF